MSDPKNDRAPDCPECNGTGTDIWRSGDGDVISVYCDACEGTGKMSEPKKEFFDDDNPCPHCGYWLDAHSVADGQPGAASKPDDITVCVNCAGVLSFTEDLRLRKPSPAELLRMRGRPEWRTVEQIIRSILKMKGHDA